MEDIILETIRAICVGVIIYLLGSKKHRQLASKHKGWSFIYYGFVLIFLGTLFDITDNFPQLNKFVIIGDTPYEAFIEKFVGYLLGFVFLSIGLWRWIPSVEEVEKSKIEIEKSHKELEEAYAQITTLKRIVPICAYCKKIRSDEGYWNQVEKFISDHTDAKLSHGICPDCEKKHYTNEP